MSIHQHPTLEDTVYFWFGANDTSGSGADGASPVYDVRLAGAAAGAIPVLSGSATLLTHANYPAGAHEVAVAATAGNGFAANATYAVFVTLLVDSQNPTGFVGSFTLTPLATAAQVNNIGAASGGSVNINISEDNTTTDTIDNAAAVDKGGGLVGIPVTGHAFIAGREVTIAGTVNYNGAFAIISQTANEVVITDTFVSETFTGSETIVSSIKGEVFVGSVQGGTFASLEAADDVVHDIDDTGNDIDIVYGCSVGGGRTASEVSILANVSGNTDEIKVKVFDHTGPDWEIIGTLEGSGGSTFKALDLPLLLKHTGTGTELGKTYIRFETDSTTPSNLSVDKVLVRAVNIGQSVGYANGRIWVDTVNGIAGTEAFVNGVADNPVNLIASAKNLSTSVGVPDFHIVNGSTVTLAESTVNESYFGDNWTLALGGQDVNGAYFEGALVSGVGTSATKVHYEGCNVGTMSVQIGHFDFCAFSGTVTHTLAGDYEYHNCYSNVAGAGAPTFTKTAGQAITAEWRNWMDSITVSGLEAGDVVTINGRLGTVTLNGADATIEIRGSYKSIVNNLTGSPTVNIDGAWKGSDVADTLADTGELQTNQGAWATATGFAVAGDLMGLSADAITNAKIANNAFSTEHFAANSLDGKGDWNTITPDAAGTLATYDPPTKTEMDAAHALLATPAQVNAEMVDVLQTDTPIDGKTIQEAMRYIAAVAAGLLPSGAGTGTEMFKGLDESTDRVQFTTDASGNRTAVSYDP